MNTFLQTQFYQIIGGFFHLLTIDIGSFALNLLKNFLLTPTEFLSDFDLLELETFVRDLAWLIMPLILLAGAWRVMQGRHDGDGVETMAEWLRRAFIAALGVAMVHTITGWALSGANTLIAAFLSAGTGIDGLNILFGLSANPSIVTIFLVLGLAVAFVVLVLQRAAMTAELVVHTAVGPLAAATLGWNTDSPVFNTWLREILSIAITYVLQTMLIWFLLRKIGYWGSATDGGRLVILGLFGVMLKGPQVIRQYVYSTGVGGTLLNGAAQAGRMATTAMLLRALPAALAAV